MKKGEDLKAFVLLVSTSWQP
uniref:Uncharacterized protein n=1 Tax=Arundo donax TaxID=35708 RepID=A0A0A8ZY92_ARUDO